MNLECAQCQARYRIDDAVIPPQGARVRCRHCSTVIEIPAPVIELAPSDLELIPPPPAGRASVADAPPNLVEIPTFEPPSARPRTEPAPPPSPVSPAPAPIAPAPAPPQAPASTAPGQVDSFEHFGQAPSAPPPVSEEFERFSPVLAGGGPLAPHPAHAPSSEQISSPAEPSNAPVFASAPSHVETGSPSPGEPAGVTAAAEPALAAAAEPALAGAAPGAAPVSGPVVGAIAGGTPIPEGLSPEEKTKHEKARRLARVLASDIAIYNREKKDQGAREGNLVAVLGYEIKKSWEVYKERVGAEFANSTPYFRDALNDMLAEGKKIF
jgi:predicted Zn finger-like uncharacterized protein